MPIVKQILLLIWGLLMRLIWKEYRSNEDQLKSSVRRIRYMDESLPEDVEDVLQLSAMLEVREYDFFDLAYRWWFGRAPNNRILERHFIRYMFNKIVPYWVRDYCRMIAVLQSQGMLTKEKIGISRLPDATPQSVRAGLRYFVMLLIAMGLLVLIAELTVQFRVMPCMFPPCY